MHSQRSLSLSLLVYPCFSLSVFLSLSLDTPLSASIGYFCWTSLIVSPSVSPLPPPPKPENKETTPQKTSPNKAKYATRRMPSSLCYPITAFSHNKSLQQYSQLLFQTTKQGNTYLRINLTPQVVCKESLQPQCATRERVSLSRLPQPLNAYILLVNFAMGASWSKKLWTEQLTTLSLNPISPGATHSNVSETGNSLQ